MSLVDELIADGTIKKNDSQAKRPSQPKGSLVDEFIADGTIKSRPPSSELRAGDRLGPFIITAGRSDHPIHYGTHSAPGVYDIGGNQIKALGMTLDEAAKKVADMGYVVAVRRKGQTNIQSDHLHFTNPSLAPNETKRISKQRNVINPFVFSGSAPSQPSTSVNIPEAWSKPAKANKPLPLQSSRWQEAQAITQPRNLVEELIADGTIRSNVPSNVNIPEAWSKPAKKPAPEKLLTMPRGTVNIPDVPPVTESRFAPPALDAKLPNVDDPFSNYEWEKLTPEQRAVVVERDEEAKKMAKSDAAQINDMLAAGMTAFGVAPGLLVGKEAAAQIAESGATSLAKSYVAGRAVEKVGKIAQGARGRALAEQDAPKSPPRGQIADILRAMDDAALAEAATQALEAGDAKGLADIAKAQEQRHAVNPEGAGFIAQNVAGLANPTLAGAVVSGKVVNPAIWGLGAGHDMAARVYLEQMREQGVNLSDSKEVAKFLDDPAKTARARNAAIAAGVPVGAINAVAIGLGGLVSGDIMRVSPKKGEALADTIIRALRPNKGKLLAGTMADAAIVAGGVGAGEVAGDISQDKPVNWSSALGAAGSSLLAGALLAGAHAGKERILGAIKGKPNPAHVQALVEAETRARAEAVPSPSQAVKGKPDVVRPIEVAPTGEGVPAPEATTPIPIVAQEPVRASKKGKATTVEVEADASASPEALFSRDASGVIDTTPNATSAEAAKPLAAREAHPSLLETATAESPVERIEPAPLQDGKRAKRLPDIVLDLQKAIGKRIHKSKMEDALGKYFPGSAKIAVRASNDLSTIGHELAHSLDDAYGIAGDWDSRKKSSPFDNELLQPALQFTSSPKYPRWEKRAEGVAEFFRAYIINPEEAKRIAPNFYEHVRKTVPENVMRKIETFGDDVRRWHSLPASEKMKSNIRFEIKKTSAVQKVKDIFAKPVYPFETTPIQRVQGKMFDRLDPLERAIRKAYDLQGTPEKADPLITTMRRLAGVTSKAEAVIEHGMIGIGAKNRKVVEGTKSGFAETMYGGFDRSSEAALKADIEDTAAYMISERAVDYAEKVAKRDGIRPEDVDLTNIGGGIDPDYFVHFQHLLDFDKLPVARKNVILDGAERYRRWADALLWYLKDSDVISDKRLDAMREANPFYVNMHRVFDDIDTVDMLKTFRGSTREINHPYVNLMISTYRAIEMGDRNAFLLQVRDALTGGRKMYQGKVKDFAAIGSRAKSGDDNTIKISVNGNPEYWTFEKDLYDTIVKWSKSGHHNIVTKSASIVRNAITHSPAFLVRNVIRDFISRLVVSHIPGNRLSHLNAKENQKYLTEFRLAGGDQAGHYIRTQVDFHTEQSKLVKSLAKDKNTILSTPGMLLDKYKAAARESELVGRLSEYARAKEYALKQGMSETEAQNYAAGQARDLLDFAVAGDLVRTINSYIPFTNAAIQGVRRAMRAAKTDPAGFTARWAAFVVAPSLVEYAWNHTTSHIDEYRQLPAYLRDMFWNFKLGGDTWLRIPKPFEIGVMASGVTRAIDHAAGGKHPFEGYGHSVYKAFMPVDESAIAGGPLSWITENIANYDFFRDKSIVSPYEEDLLLPLRKGTSHASALGRGGQWLSEHIGLGVDARKIDNAIISSFGGLGRAATVLSSSGDKTRNRTVDFGDAATGLFAASPIYQSRDVQYVMQKAKSIGRKGAAPIRQLSDAIADAYNETTNKGRDEKGKIVRKMAAELRPVVDRWVQEKAEGKPVSDNPYARQ